MALGVYWATLSLCLFLVVLMLDRMGFFSRKNHLEVDGRTVLITGGSQGMGRALGKLLARKGANVIIVARNAAKLAEALQYISSSAKDPQKQRFHTISADLTKSDENIRIINEATKWNNGHPPDIVWANAGSSYPHLFIDTDIDTLRSQMDTNYWTAAYLAHATLRAWLEPTASKSTPPDDKPRHFIMTSSLGALVGLAGYGTYAPAKAAMRSLADNLRSELHLYNGHRRTNPTSGPPADVKIHCVLPGSITSPGYEEENKVKHPVTKILEEGDTKQTEDEVAAAAVKGLEHGEFLVTTTLLGRAMKASMMGSSPRSHWLVDTLIAGVINWAWLFIGPDLDKKVSQYGEKNPVQLPS